MKNPHRFLSIASALLLISGLFWIFKPKSHQSAERDLKFQGGIEKVTEIPVAPDGNVTNEPPPSNTTAAVSVELPRPNYHSEDPSWPVSPQVKMLLGSEEIAAGKPVLRPDGSAVRERIVRNPHFKYPNLRVIETFRPLPDGNGFEPRPVVEIAVADHVLVQPARTLDMDEIDKLAASIGGSVRSVMPLSGNVLIAFDGGQPGSLAAAHATLARQPLVKSAEPDPVVHAFATFPDDPDLAKLWGIHNTGQTVNFTAGIVDADIDAPEVWEITTGSRNVVIAVLDTGVDYNHPDLKDNIAVNLGEIPGNGIDDDANGFIDDYNGWDFSEGDNNPFDGHSHGTHCAGSIGASGNDGSGIVGVNWQVGILPVKFLDDGGSGTGSDAIEAIHYSRIRGVRISSNSWGGGATSDAMKSAIDQAGAAGQIFVAAAGNNGNSTPQYPAAYTSTNIISVAASNSQDGLASFSCFDDGSGWVDVAAPGVSIYSTMPGGSYGFKDGTSMATPHVAGIMGLILSIQPAIPVIQAIDWVKNTVDTKTAFNGQMTSGGRVNARKALYNNISTPLINLVATTFTDNGDGNGIPNPGEIVNLTTQLRNVSSVAANSVNATITLAAPDPYLNITSGSSALGNLASLAQTTANFTFSIAANTPTPRAVTLNLTTVDAANNTRVTPIPMMLYTMTSVTGTVREIDGSPVAGASVSFAGPLRGSVSTTADGSYMLSLVDGSHEISVSKTAFTPSTARLVQVPPAASGMDFVLSQPRVNTSVPSLAATVGADGRVTLDVPLVNDGSAPATFTVRELEYGGDKNGDAAGPTYNWIDISATAPALEVADLAFNQYDYFNAGPLPLAMDFPFFENSFRSFRVNHMGWISFSNASRSVYDFRVELPQRDRPENMIAFAWAGQMDWTPWKPGDYYNPNYIAGARRLFYQQVDPQTYVITAHRWANGEFDLLTSQIVLKRDGTILLQYGAYTGPQGGTTTYHAGPRIYIAGMQDAEGRRGMTPVLGPTRVMPTNGTVIRMRPVVGAPWLKTDLHNGILQPGDAARNLRVTLDAKGLAAGTYTTKLVLDTTDASRPVLEIPVTLTVGAGDSSLAWVTPVAGVSATLGATLPLEVQILGPTASVTGVNFFNGSTLLGAGVLNGTDRYTFNWTNVPAGAFDLVAVATLSDGRKLSTPVRPASAGSGFRVAIDALDSASTTPVISYNRAMVERFGSPFVNFETAANTVYARPVTITRSGSVATVSIPLSYLLRFGYYNSLPVTETMTITGAAQLEYNGTHTLTYSSVSGSNYLYTFPVTGTPTTPSSGAQLSDFSRMVVSDGRRSIRMAGQATRKVALPATYNVTANTVLEFDFLGSASAGTGVFGVGLDNDNTLSASRVFQVWGKKTNWGSNRSYHNYVEDISDSTAPRWRHYRIPVGQHYTGAQNQLILMQTNDDWYYRHDADATYRNVTLYEDPNAASDYTHQWTVTDAPATRTGEEMTHTWLQPGEKSVALVTSLSAQSATASRSVQIGGSGVFGASVNFQPANAFTPIGYVPDSGAVFADRLNGYSYGWLGSANTTAVDAEYPVMSKFQELDTYIRQTTVQTWEMAVPNGTYRIYGAAGFAFVGSTTATSSNWLKVEGQTLIDKNLPKDTFTDGITNVAVTDGRLTLTSHRNTAYVNLLDITRTDGANIAPVASFTASLLGGDAPVEISFDASSSFVNNGNIVSYAWNFGDGTTATGSSPTHTFASPGLRVVTLTVTDSNGSTATTSTALSITGTAQVATSLILTPETVTLVSGGTRQFTTTVLDQFAQALIPQPPVTWQVSSGGTITGTGLFTAGPTPGGPHTVTAASGALSDSAGVTIVAALATTISVTPSAAAVTSGDSQAFSATVFDQFGQPLNPQPGVIWQVSGGGSINGSGLFTAGAEAGGPFTVTATRGAASGTAEISVNSVPPVANSLVVTPPNPLVVSAVTLQFSAVVSDQFGQPLNPQPAITWSASGGGSISSGGLLTAGASTGSFTVTASSSGLQASTGFTVTEIPATSVFAAHFNNGTGSGGDDLASIYNWNGAIGTNGTLVTTIGNVAVSQGATDGTGVPLASGQSTSGGFLFAVPATDSSGVSLLHTTDLTASNVFQDNPQTNWFRAGNDSLVDLKVGDITRLSVYTRPATTATVMRFALRVGGNWVVSTTSFTQSNLNVYEKRALSNLTAANAWYGGVFTSGSSLDDDLTGTPTVTLNASEPVTGCGWYADTDLQTGANSRVRIDSFMIHANVQPPPATGYAAWAGSAFPAGSGEGDRAPEFDYDHDGLTNLLEYALGTDPAAASTAPAGQVVAEGGNKYLQLQWTRPNDRTDIITTGEVSPDLSPGSWTSHPGEVSTAITPTGEGMETVTVRDLSLLSGHTRRFLRARIVIVP